jgi:drug/metabolite transporter (DMT)-like permease
LLGKDTSITPRIALGALHVGALFFGLAGVLGKLAQTTPAVIVFGRTVFAVLALACFARWAGGKRWRRPSSRDGRRLVLGGVLLAAHWLTFFIAIKVAGVAIATLGFASFPAFTVLLESILFRERVRPMEAGLVLLVSVGLVLVTPTFDLASQATSGLLWGVGSGLLFALLSLNNRATSASVPAVQAALVQNAVVAALLLPFAAPQLPSVTAMDWLWIALLGVFCTGLAHSLFVASLAVVKARTAAVVFAMEPIYGIALAWLVFGEQPSVMMLAGGALIIFAIALASLAPARHQAPAG